MKPEIIIFSILICFFSLFFFQKLFLQKGILDNVNFRSSHTTEATRNGGIGIFLTVLIISIVFYLTGYEIFDYSILVPLAILITVGFYDDIYSVDFKLKFIFQIIAAKIIIDNGLIIDNLHGVFGLYEISRILAQLLTILVIVSIINAINFIDGLDGLAISITIIFIASFQFFAFLNTDLYYLSIIITTCLIPLYYFNFRDKNKVFLGDSGSYLLGGIVSVYVLYILSQDYIIKSQFDVHKILFVGSILIYPIIDIIRIFVFRIYNGKSPFIADKNHLHHLILNYVKSHFLTVLIIVVFSIITIVLTQLLF